MMAQCSHWVHMPSWAAWPIDKHARCTYLCKTYEAVLHIIRNWTSNKIMFKWLQSRRCKNPRKCTVKNTRLHNSIECILNFAVSRPVLHSCRLAGKTFGKCKKSNKLCNVDSRNVSRISPFRRKTEILKLSLHFTFDSFAQSAVVLFEIDIFSVWSDWRIVRDITSNSQFLKGVGERFFHWCLGKQNIIFFLAMRSLSSFSLIIDNHVLNKFDIPLKLYNILPGCNYQSILVNRGIYHRTRLQRSHLRLLILARQRSKLQDII